MRNFQLERIPAEVGSLTPLSSEASHHLLRVLRAKVGQQVRVFDGSGLEATAELASVNPQGIAELRLLTTPVRNAPSWPLHLLIGLPKGPSMDLSVRMATEAGVTHIHPFRGARSQQKGEKRDRWKKIAASAAQQCGRADVPEVYALSTLDEILAALPEGTSGWVAHPATTTHQRTIQGPAALLLGPEGGLTDREVQAALTAGFSTLSLGRWILRTSTASAVGVSWVASQQR